MSPPHRERAGVVCVQDSRLLCVQMRDPRTRIAQWFVPGGAIEAGESAIAAAVRETLEETGYHVVADPTRVRTASYSYVWDGVERAITTHFFAAKLADPALPPLPVHDADYNESTHWLPLDDVASRLGFHATILNAVSSLLRDA